MVRCTKDVRHLDAVHGLKKVYSAKIAITHVISGFRTLGGPSNTLYYLQSFSRVFQRTRKFQIRSASGRERIFLFTIFRRKFLTTEFAPPLIEIT
jgi:hypothetical protein